MEEAGKFEDRRDVRVFLGDLMGDVGLALGPKLDLKRDDSLLNLLHFCGFLILIEKLRRR